MSDNFEDRYGWEPDSDYETIKTNDSDGKKWKKMCDMSTKCPTNVLGQTKEMSRKGGKK